MPLFAVKIVIPVNMHWAEKAADLQMTAVDKTLPGPRLERSIELIDQILHHRLQPGVSDSSQQHALHPNPYPFSPQKSILIPQIAMVEIAKSKQEIATATPNPAARTAVRTGCARSVRRASVAIMATPRPSSSSTPPRSCHRRDGSRSGPGR